MIIAKWESRSGKHWVQLIKQGSGYSYTSPDAGGSLGSNVTTDAQAIQALADKVLTGYFQPDANTTPMQRTI
jgi:hypothetical protein